MTPESPPATPRTITPNTNPTDADKLARIKQITRAHATPTSNTGAHRLAQLILDVSNGKA